MTDIFISYKQKDRSSVERLARALRARGMDVFYDEKLIKGEAWSARVRDEVDRARCVIVLWTQTSVGPDRAYASEWMAREAEQARRKARLVPVLMDEGRAPVVHEALGPVSLIGWNGSGDDPRLDALLERVQGIVGWPATPQRRPSPYSGGVGEPDMALAYDGPALSTGLQSPTMAPDGRDELQAAMAEARERGARRVGEIMAGPGMLAADAFAIRIGATPATVRRKAARREVLGLRDARRGARYPAWQVADDGALLPALPELFGILGDSPWAVYRFLTQPNPAFGGGAPVSSLRAGDVGPVLDVARGHARLDFG